MLTRSKLQRLSENCANLLFYSESIEDSNTEGIMEYNREIKQALRKIIIANEISDRMIICVTGMQGTGKTTLMKNFYNIDDSVMNIALGRGERLPIMITESDISDVEMYAVGLEKTSDGYSRKKVKVTSEEFVEFSKAEDEDSTIMYMELLVPRKYVNKSVRASFMLLPGYERKESYWNTLIDFSVKCSDTAIMVLTAEKLADANNAQLLEKIKELFGDNVIYALSHSDEKADKNENVKQTLMRLLGIDSNQCDRVVCTGAYAQDNLNDQWKKELQNAIANYSAHPDAMDQRSIEYLEEIISKELRPAVRKIKKMVEDSTDEVMTSFKNSLWLDSFDKEAGKMRKRLQKTLSVKFKEAQSKDREALRNLMQAQPGKNFGGHVRRCLFGESLKDLDKSEKLIDNAMKDVQGKYRYQLAFSEAVVNHTDMLCAGKERDETLQIGSSVGNTVLLSKNDEERELMLTDVTTIVSKNEKQLVSSNTKEIMQAIVQCGTQYFGLCMTDGLYSEQYIVVPELEKSKLSREDIAGCIRETEKFALGILGVTGIDYLKDGVINLVPALAKVLKVNIPVASGIVTSIIGVGAAKAMISDYNMLQLKDYYSYSKAIASVYENLEQQYLGMYDDFIEALKERVECYLTDCVGATFETIKKQNVLIATKKLMNDLDEIREELKVDSYALTKLIRG